MIRVLFVNGGILGLSSFYRFLVEYLPRQSQIDGTHVVLTHDLTLFDRAVRRIVCQRLWKDGVLGLRNVDLARFRRELHAGLLARRRIASLGPRRFDVIHFHRQATAYGSLDLMRRVPSIVSIDCTQDAVLDTATSAAERSSYVPNLRVDGTVFRRAAAIVAISEWAAKSVHARYPDCRTPVHVLPNPVLLEHFDRAWIDMRRARVRADGKPRVLFVGGDFPRKGGFDLLEAWAAGHFNRTATLDIVTNWDLPTPLPPGVTVWRHIEAHSQEWRARWAEADLFVMPTRNEAFGLVYQEAAAAGLPAIGTVLNAIPEIVHDGDTGVLVQPGDIGALASAMHALVDSAELRDRMGLRARQLIESAASPDVYMDRLTAIIMEAAGSRRI
jgi:glycosyltransferase involved in cell wall biosynthesis